MLNISRFCTDVCREGSGARTFFTGILMWGFGMGCFNASFHNFIVDEYHIGGFDRGVLEFMREMSGVLLVCVLAAMSRFSDWRVLRIGISVNHVVTVFYSLLGGWVFDRYGAGVLFATAAVMALCNLAFALTVPKPSAL